MIVADQATSLILTGNGDVLEPEHGVCAIGSGSGFAIAAAKALFEINGMDADTIAKKALLIASELCIYTNNNIVLEGIDLSS